MITGATIALIIIFMLVGVTFLAIPVIFLAVAIKKNDEPDQQAVDGMLTSLFIGLVTLGASYAMLITAVHYGIL